MGGVGFWYEGEGREEVESMIEDVVREGVGMW